MPYNKDGLAAGKDDIEYHGESRVFETEVTITDYEAGGVPFDPVTDTGHARVDYVACYVSDGSTDYIVRFDHVNSTLRVITISDGSEVADATTINLPVRVQVYGMG